MTRKECLAEGIEKSDIVECPMCGKCDDLQGFDVLGACGANVFCTDCHCEFEPSTGVVHECDVDAAEASRIAESKKGTPVHGFNYKVEVVSRDGTKPRSRSKIAYAKRTRGGKK